MHEKLWMNAMIGFNDCMSINIEHKLIKMNFEDWIIEDSYFRRNYGEPPSGTDDVAPKKVFQSIES